MAMFWTYPGHETYVGQNLVVLHCHGAPSGRPRSPRVKCEMRKKRTRPYLPVATQRLVLLVMSDKTAFCGHLI